MAADRSLIAPTRLTVGMTTRALKSKFPTMGLSLQMIHLTG